MTIVRRLGIILLIILLCCMAMMLYNLTITGKLQRDALQQIASGFREMKRSEPPDSGKALEKIIGSMSVEEKIGQMLMVGFSGSGSGDAKRFIKNYHVGGLIFFRANMSSLTQAKDLVSEIQDYSKQCNGIMMLLATDQEGGKVITIRSEICPVFRSNSEISDDDDGIEKVKEQAEKTAEIFKEIGLNMNLAPVIDVRTNAANRVIGSRSYGSDSATVSILGSTYIRYLQKSRVIATAKHFPGHGPTDVDSHHGLPIVDLDVNEVRSTHLLPFENAVSQGVEAVMTAHVVYKCFDDKPATLSSAILSDLLRRQIGFDGVIITDSMGMDAIIKNYPFEKAVVDAVNAGADIILVARDDSLKLRAWNALLDAVKNGRLNESRIDESVMRILRLKEKYGLLKT